MTDTQTHRNGQMRDGETPRSWPAGFMERVSPEPNSGCWLWTGTGDGRYGYFWFDGKMRRAHVLSWGIANNAPVPKGLFVLHSCDVPACVNPAHLSVGTQSQNMKDAVRRGRVKPPIQQVRTSCDAGHEYTPENTFIRSSGERRCRLCDRRYKLKRNERIRLAVAAYDAALAAKEGEL